MKRNLKTVMKDVDRLPILCLLVGVFLVLGFLISWLGWRAIPLLLVSVLYLWNWRWGLVITIAALWAFIV